MNDKTARVGIVMGSDSDLPTMEPGAAILRELGVDYAQGYHISKPEPFDTIWGDGASQEGVIGAD